MDGASSSHGGGQRFESASAYQNATFDAAHVTQTERRF
jgi:hypothetical protein